MESKCSCPECLIFMLLFWNRFTFSCHTTFRILYSEGSPNSCSGTLLFILNPVMLQPLNSIPNSDKNKKSCFGIVFYRPHVFVIRFLWDILEKYSSCTSWSVTRRIFCMYFRLYWIDRNYKIWLPQILIFLLIITFAVPFVFRHGVLERRRSDVPHTASRKIRSGPGEVLLGRNPPGAQVFTQKRNRLQACIETFVDISFAKFWDFSPEFSNSLTLHN